MPALRLWGIRRSIGLAIVAALLVVVVLVGGALWYAGFPGIRRDSAVTAGTLFDLLKLVFAVVAGLGGVAALVVAYRRQRVAEHTNRLAEFAHQLAHAADVRAEVTKALAEAADERAKVETDRNGVRLFNERFAKAAEQLGSDKAAVRLAGVYAMAGLADDWYEGRQTCIDVLCAYLRMPYSSPPDASSGKGDPLNQEAAEEVEKEALAAHQEREVRQTVIGLISAHLRLEVGDPTSWCGHDFDFTGAVFNGGNFEEAKFGSGMVSFVGATFSGARVSFAGATFSGARVSFDGATFSGARVSFLWTTFSGGTVSFDGATFSDGTVPFDGARFSGGTVSFDGATFSGGRMYFRGATFSGARVSFDGATFSGASVSFDGATISAGRVSFYKATFSGGVVTFAGASCSEPPKFDAWPDGNPPANLISPEV